MIKKLNTISVICENPICRKEFQKCKKEYNRSISRGTKQYCCMSCFGKDKGKMSLDNVPLEIKIQNQKNISNFSGNRKTLLSPFKYFVKVMKNQNRSDKWSDDIDINYLFDLWNRQNGKCPYTGFNLILPKNTTGFEDKKIDIRNASIDRIDNSKGYIKSNIQFVSVMANWAKNILSDEELIEFCVAVSAYRGIK